MVKRKRIKMLTVSMNGILVGNLERHATGALSFQYDNTWLESPGARPISLSLPLAKNRFEGDIVYNFFDNLLPDNPQIRAHIQARFQTVTDKPFELLAAIGKDCIGAIQISEQVNSDIKCIEAKAVTEKEIAELLRNYREAPLGMDKQIDDFRISIAGAQEKSAFLYHDQQWCRPQGMTPTSHIFKLPIGVIEHQNMDLSDSCENEWLCTEIAKAFGLKVANCEIKKFEDVKVLVVERFDRKLAEDSSWIMRLPQEDMCQALGYSPNLKYQGDGGPGINEIMKLLLNSINAVEDRDNFYRAQVLFWLLAAIDGHAKNFSIFIGPYGRYRLTPLYDIMSGYPLQLPSRRLKMAMALKGKNNHYGWKMAQRRHFMTTAKHVKYSVKHAEMILDQMLAQVDNVITSVSNKLPKKFPDYIAESIFNGMALAKKRFS